MTRPAVHNFEENPMSSLHAINRERTGARIAQSKSVMPLIGPLLDAWDGLANDTKGMLRQESPSLCECLDKINAAMEGGLIPHED